MYLISVTVYKLPEIKIYNCHKFEYFSKNVIFIIIFMQATLIFNHFSKYRPIVL